MVNLEWGIFGAYRAVFGAIYLPRLMNWRVAEASKSKADCQEIAKNVGEDE